MNIPIALITAIDNEGLMACAWNARKLETCEREQRDAKRKGKGKQNKTKKKKGEKNVDRYIRTRINLGLGENHASNRAYLRLGTGSASECKETGAGGRRTGGGPIPYEK